MGPAGIEIIMLGNSVAPPVMKAVVETLMRA
jgi:hypothetical protein